MNLLPTKLHLLIFVIVFNASAKDVLPVKNTVRLCVQSQAPYILKNTSDKFVGTLSEKIKNIFNHIPSVQVELIEMPLKRCLNKISFGQEIDGIAFIQKSPNLSLLVDFVTRPVRIKYKIFFSTKNINPIYALSPKESFLEYIIGQVRGHATTPFFEDAVRNGFIKEYNVNGHKQLVYMLKNGRVDFITTNEDLMQSHLGKNYKQFNIIKNLKYEYIKEFYIAPISKNSKYIDLLKGK